MSDDLKDSWSVMVAAMPYSVVVTVLQGVEQSQWSWKKLCVQSQRGFEGECGGDEPARLAGWRGWDGDALSLWDGQD